MVVAKNDESFSVCPNAIQGDQINMSVLFWYLVKRDLSSVHLRTLASLFTRYQNSTAIYILSPCTPLYKIPTNYVIIDVSPLQKIKYRAVH